MRLRLLAITPVLGALLAFWVAPTIQEQEPPKEQEVKLRTALVVVTAQARTANGEVLQSLASRDFLLYDNKVQQEIAHFEREARPLAVALMVDTSGSMGQKHLRNAHLIAKQLLLYMEEDDEAALFDAGDKPKLLAPLTRDKTGILKTLDRLIWRVNYVGRGIPPAGILEGRGVFIHDVVHAGASYLKMASRTRQRVLAVITDNITVPGNAYSEGDALSMALENEVLVIGFITGDATSHLMLNKYVNGNVGAYAEKTDGRAIVVKGGEELLKIPSIVNQVRTRYVLGYYPATLDPPDKPHSITLRVQDAVTAKYGQVKLSYRRRYQPVIE